MANRPPGEVAAPAARSGQPRDRAAASTPSESPPSGPLVFVVTHGVTARFLMLDLLLYLARQGHDVRVFAAGGHDLDAVAAAGIAVTAVPLQREIRPLADLRALFRLYRELRRIRPALVNAGTPKAGLLAMIAAWLLRVPRRLYTLRGLRLETARGAKRLLLTTTERVAAACAQRVVCVSASLRQRAIDLRLVAAERATVLADGSSKGVDLERFRPANENDLGEPGTGEKDPALRRWRDKLGLTDDEPVIGFVGRFVRDKGIEDLLAAFDEQVLPRHPRARLLLVGDFEDGDPVSPATRQRIESGAALLRPGFVDDSAPLYRLMTLLAFPSYREGFPNAPLEAAASGLPVVGFRATGVVDAVAEGETGLLVDIGDRHGLGEGLAALLDDPARARRLGQAGRRRAEERFSQERLWRAWAEELASDG
ncbi:MAG: glycosyltransferase family 4 protein [Acidobacteriota bacterium]